jgi:hypothetical protein
MLPYTIWFEAEVWAPDTWTPHDTNSDVIVTFADGARWVATFFSYANIATLTAKNQSTGECLAGAYFWANDMILVDAIRRPRIELIIQHLLEEQSFTHVFRRLHDEGQAEDRA